MDHWLNRGFPIINFIPTLYILFWLHWHTFLYLCFFHSSHITPKQHLLWSHSLVEPLPPPCTHSMLMYAMGQCHSEMPSMFSKCKYRTEDNQETDAWQYQSFAISLMFKTAQTHHRWSEGITNLHDYLKKMLFPSEQHVGAQMLQIVTIAHHT